MKLYSNDKYGISFYYPEKWEVSESESSGAISRELSTVVRTMKQTFPNRAGSLCCIRPETLANSTLLPDEGLEKGKALHREYAEHFIAQRGATPKQVDDTFARQTYTTDLAAAVRDADLISESVPESMSIKESFWREASKLAP